jgi:osmotically-inducible protein OsmY
MKRTALGAWSAWRLIAGLAIAAAPLVAGATDMPAPAGSNPTDKAPSASAPLQQSNSAADQKITDAVRRALAEDKRLSPSAQSVSIATVNGEVTLRGRVDDEKEKMIVATKPKGVPGVEKINDQLEVTKAR